MENAKTELHNTAEVRPEAGGFFVMGKKAPFGSSWMLTRMREQRWCLQKRILATWLTTARKHC